MSCGTPLAVKEMWNPPRLIAMDAISVNQMNGMDHRENLWFPGLLSKSEEPELRPTLISVLGTQLWPYVNGLAVEGYRIIKSPVVRRSAGKDAAGCRHVWRNAGRV